MDTRRTYLKSVSALVPGDVLDVQSLGMVGYGVRYHTVTTVPSRRVSEPQEFVFQLQGDVPGKSEAYGWMGRGREGEMARVLRPR